MLGTSCLLTFRSCSTCSTQKVSHTVAEERRVGGRRVGCCRGACWVNSRQGSGQQRSAGAGCINLHLSCLGLFRDVVRSLIGLSRRREPASHLGMGIERGRLTVSSLRLSLTLIATEAPAVKTSRQWCQAMLMLKLGEDAAYLGLTSRALDSSRSSPSLVI